MLTKFRSLCAVPANYEVLLCVGGARHLYEMLPLSVPQSLSMAVLNTGLWSALWAETISMLRACASMPVSVFGKDGCAPGNADCLANLCCVVLQNETADGISLPEHLLPRAAYTVADLTSDLGFRQIDLSRYDCAFASSGKAFGVSGMTIVVISPNFLQQLRSDLLPLQSLQKSAQHRSLYTTPPLVCLDVFGHMLDWLIAEGGMSAVTLRQRRRSALIYEQLSPVLCISNYSPY